MTTFETFKLSELRLDEKNYRTGEVSSQRDAILAVIADQKNKLVNLAKDILQEGGVSPGEPIWVTRAETTGYIVIEGNRRVTALKLLETPTLADGTLVEKEFRVLAQQFALKPIRELTAVVFPTYESADNWRRRRHLSTESGVGLQRWSTLAKARADRDHGVKARRSLAVFEYLADGTDDWTAIADALDPRWTTVERVLNAEPMKKVLGIDIDQRTGKISFENENEVAGRKLLKAILAAMANTAFKFEEVEKKEDREAFLSRFAGMSVKAKPAEPGVPRPAPAPVPSPPQPEPPQPKPTPKGRTEAPRKTLAPKTGARVFQVKAGRLNEIYLECRNLVVSSNENAAALLLRVFIELSTEAFLSEKGVTLPHKFGKAGKTSWDDIGIPLVAKIQIALDMFDTSKKAKEFQAVRVGLDEHSHGVASINTLHGYFHNRKLTPEASNVMKAWDIWEPYLSALHSAR
jgi:hypothetical protein